MTVTCKKCGKKYVSVVPVRFAKGFSESGLVAGGEIGKTQTKGSVSDCHECRGQDQK